MSSVYSTAISGMNAALSRLSNAASNIANASSEGALPTSSNPKATSYTPTDVITITDNTGDHHLGVRTQLVERSPAYTVARDPTAPYANAEGLVAAPNVDVAAEIVDALTAQLAYEASAKLIGVQKDMQQSLLDAIK